MALTPADLRDLRSGAQAATEIGSGPVVGGLEDPREILALEPDLARGLSGRAAAEATSACTARIARIHAGAWGARVAGKDPEGFGLLVIEGHLVRRVGQGSRFGAELIGPGDLLYPRQTADLAASMPLERSWTALSDLRVAVLDDHFVARASRYPTIATQLFDRAMSGSRNQAVAMAIVHQPRIDRRLHMLLWHLADRWGRIGTAGVTVELPLTHSLLGELVVAARPTVSTALSQLRREGRVDRDGDAWVLLGGPPEEVELATLATRRAATSA